MPVTLSRDPEWAALRALLPADLDTTAFQYGALLRKRRRGIASAEALLRCVLAYSCEQSLRSTAAWATAAGIATVSDVALLERFRHSGGWLGHLVWQLLPTAPTPDLPIRRLRLLDATTLSAPGSRQTDWRVHVGLDLAAHRLDHLRLTTDAEGETLTHLPLQPGDLVVVDRGYATFRTVRYCVEQGAHLLVRLPWQPSRLQHPDSTPVALMALLRTLPYGAQAVWPVQMGTGPGTPPRPGRLLVARYPEAQAQQARVRRQQRARKTGQAKRIRDPRTLEASEYLILFTDVPADQLTAEQALALYRMRWQIELLFKRLKGLLHLAALPAKDPHLARTWILAKLLLALLIDRLVHPAETFPPSAGPSAESLAAHAVAVSYAVPRDSGDGLYA